MGQLIDFNNLKNKKINKKHIIYFIFIIIILYIFYSIFLLVKTPTDTVTIKTGTLTLEESTNGYIIREETVLKGENYKNDLTPIISEGEKVAKGQTVFRYSSEDEDETKSKIEELNVEIQETLQNEPEILSKMKNLTDIKNLDKQIDEKILDLHTITDMHTISEYKKEIEEMANKKAKIFGESSPKGSYIKDLIKQKEQYEDKLKNSSEYINAPVSGVVSYRVDGFENILNASDFNNLSEKKLDELGIKTGKIISTSQEEGKIINNFNCYLGAVLSSEASRNAKIGDSVTITLSKGNEIDAKVKHISKEDNNKVLIIFELKTLTEELIQYRKISFNITWWSYSGLKVPNTSILEDKDGLMYVERIKASEIQKVIVKVLKQNDQYSIVRYYNEEEQNSLGIDSKTYKKITQFDNILLYPSQM